MFNGIIKNTGKVYKINNYKKGYILEIKTNINLLNKEIGESFSCSGACLTLEKKRNKIATFYVSKETLKKTNFKLLKVNHLINIEKPLKFGQRISGHFVQGHVDTTSKVKAITILGKSWLIKFHLSKNYSKYVIEKGSITINGVSLTIAKIIKSEFQIAVIPHTLKLTNLINLKKNDIVNVEFDILGKYIKKYLINKK
jgi:riboflavin synthase